MDYLSGLNDQQHKAVTFQGGPLLLLAGAGSGKTRVITTRIAYLIDQLGFSPYSILAVTFTNKAAGEMRERVNSMVPGAENVMIKTFHSFGAWMLRRNGDSLGLKSSFTIYDDDDVNALIKSLVPTASRSEIKQFARDISRCKDDNLSPDDNLTHINSHPNFNNIYLRYEARLKEIGNVDFGDLISLPKKLLSTNKEISSRFQSRFKVILVDEYQDTNRAQFELLQNLTGEDTWVCVVGDDDQSIYKFRGAEVRNILDFDKMFPGTQVIKLEENYRSTGHILSIASAVVKNNLNRLGKTLWTSKGDGLKPTIKYLENGEAEAEFIASKLVDGDLNETAILYRTNAQSRQLESTFIRSGIPYKIIGTLRFYEREEIKDTLALLSFILNSKDEIAFRRVINKPVRGIGKTSLDKIILDSRNYDNDYLETILKTTLLKGKAKKGCTEFYDFISELKELDFTQDLGHFIRRVIEDSGLLDYHRSQDEAIGSGKVDNLEELINSSSKYSGDSALSDFLEAVELDQSSFNRDDEEDDTPKVTLITMHNTKGLEFDRVFITGMENGLFPRSEKLEDDDELEEERRLFYVSITRARKELCFTSCKSRILHGKFIDSSPSIFLGEIPEDFVIGDTPSNSNSFTNSTFKRGDNVYHDDYGSGYIIKVTDNGKHELVLVKFETGQVKQFIPEFSPLEKIARY
ncbi:hypothetical protein EW093_11880 [Thiospirochaeta perfilievii]|uniref:DNA 3'-5' helicase n=1 Tax=Thiospirochaeta perfilievii TaxID=252967 RepID=A0A5C1QE95_9SPIO|nr:UvrD-helicase domain-containing protein [Thiospirochaeta perfilievii]QEN05380.1 hypothetical protein EW093_11880 [Thiospirochaeta perfilievii]